MAQLFTANIFNILIRLTQHFIKYVQHLAFKILKLQRQNVAARGARRRAAAAARSARRAGGRAGSAAAARDEEGSTRRKKVRVEKIQRMR